MCGIAGVFNLERERPVDNNLLQRMNQILIHRGPDDHGIYVNGQIGLAHRRLSIIDLKTGHQPMVSQEQGRVLIYNGEVYNFRELREQLEKREPFSPPTVTPKLYSSCAISKSFLGWN